MRIVNLGAVLEYGRASGVIHPSGSLGTRERSSLGGAGVRVVAKKLMTIIKDEDAKMDIDGNSYSKLLGRIQTSPATSEAGEASGSYANKYPASFKLAALITFAMLSYILKNPTRRPTPFSKSTLNPYITIVLTFLATIAKHPTSFHTLKRSVPWDKLATFFMTVPRSFMVFQGLDWTDRERWIMLTSGCAPPLDEA